MLRLHVHALIHVAFTCACIDLRCIYRCKHWNAFARVYVYMSLRFYAYANVYVNQLGVIQIVVSQTFHNCVKLEQT